MRNSSEIEALMTRLSRLPGLGPRSARRATLALLQQPVTRLQPLIEALQNAARTVRVCETCGNLDSRNPCSICTDPDRDHSVVCVVEHVGDLWALERSGVHKGLYHVLGGTLSALNGVGPDDLNVSSLLKRMQDEDVKEVILALGATVEGATTAHWLQEKLADFKLKISRPGHGMPIGGALEGLDDGTLAAALLGRKELF